MPKIIFNEIDETSTGIAEVAYPVLIPGKARAYYQESDESGAAQIPINLDDEFEFKGTGEDFAKIINWGHDDKRDYEDLGLGYQIAKVLLDRGLTVLYVVVGLEDAEIKFTETTQNETWWAKFADKSVYDLRFITTGDDDSVDAQKYATWTAEARGDATALLYIPDETAKDLAKADKYAQDLNFEHQGKNKLERYAVYSYAAGFVPNFSIVGLNTGAEKHFPGYVAYLGCFGAYVNQFASWFAFAGSQRGLLPWDVQLDASFGDLAVDQLQDRATPDHKALNPICYVRRHGNLVWGNRTLFPVFEDDVTGIVGLKASSFLNIRQLVSDIKKNLYEVAKTYTFDPNSSLLWTRFYNAATPLLEDMKSNQGIKGYKLTQVKNAEKATLHAVLRIIPIEAVEDFIFDIFLDDSIEVVE